MPIYEYQCPKGHHFEEMQSFSAKPVASCPKCKLKAKRKISLAAFHLKGSGWYSKDSTASTKKKEKESESPTAGTAADSAKPAETSTAEKPAKKEKPAKEKKPKKDKSA